MTSAVELLKGFNTPTPSTSDVLASAPTTAAVHVVREADGMVVYVGETSDLRFRLRQNSSGGSVLRDQLLAELDVTDDLPAALARFTIS
ncbi:hypothetical protein AB1207_24020 [Kineococcus endophyticus]|uniref:GIY-YIG catalytic domain-containing protein n=1 Tax=Kineococcus endophyticus TaxID=1181883 RepID=A0ABV3PEM3_9ACTN